MPTLLASAADLQAYFHPPRWSPESLPRHGEWPDADALVVALERHRPPESAIPKRSFDAVVMAACLMRAGDYAERVRTLVADAVATALLQQDWALQEPILKHFLPGCERGPAGLMVPFEACLTGLERAPERLRFRYLALQGGRACLSPAHLRFVLRQRLLLGPQPAAPVPAPAWARTALAAPLKQLRLLHRREQRRGRSTWGGLPAQDLYPPCIQEILRKAKAGLTMEHGERYNLVAFLGYFGMPVDAIVELFSATPNFDRRQTEYQARHITRGGRGSDGKYRGYHPMGCRQMKDRGFCPSQTCPGPTPVLKCESDAKKAQGQGRATMRVPRARNPA